ncbi:MAG: hypothetical protein ACO1OB_06135 [Archangium sp.]
MTNFRGAGHSPIVSSALARSVLSVTMILSSAAFARLDVQWRTNSECPAPTVPIEGEGRAEAHVDELDGQWVVTVKFFEPNGARRVQASSCDEALRAATLLLQLGAREARAADRPAPSSPAAAPADTMIDEPVPWRVSLTGGAAFDIGSLPFVEPRFAISGALSHGFLRLVIDLRAGLASRLAPGVRVQRTFETQAAGCINFELGRVALAPCAAVSAGSWAAANTTIAVASASSQMRLAANLFAGIELGALAGVRFNLVRLQPFAADEVIFTTPLISADLQLTLGWRW